MPVTPKRGALIAALVAAALILTAVPAGADANRLYSATPINGWGLDGTANAVEIGNNGIVYVGGSFANAIRFNLPPQPRTNLMAVDPTKTPGDLNFVTSFAPSVNGRVRAIASDAAGSLYIGGDFTMVGTAARSRVAKLNPNGSLDPGFIVNSPKPVRDLVVVGNKLYLVGDFVTINAQSRKRAAAVDTTSGALDPNFNPNLNGKTYAVAAQGGKLYLGGNFTTVGGVPRNFLSEVDPTFGTAVGPTFASVGDVILDLSVKDDDAGTQLFGAGGGGFNSVASWNTASGVRQWRDQANGDVQAVKYSEGNVYFGFHDGYLGNTTLRLLAANASDGFVEPSFQPASGGNTGVLALDANGTYLAAVGKFPKMDGFNVKGLSIHIDPTSP